MATTLKDVAKRAGVSFTLVSKYLNGNPQARMTPSTRERIDEALHFLDYRPSAAARTLRSGKSGLIGLVTATLTNEFFAHYADAAMREVSASNHQLILALAAPGQADAAFDTLRERGAEAIWAKLPPWEKLSPANRKRCAEMPGFAMENSLQEALNSIGRNRKQKSAIGVFFHKSWQKAFADAAGKNSVKTQIYAPPAGNEEREKFLQKLAAEADAPIFFDGWQTAAAFLEFARADAEIILNANCTGPFLADKRIKGAIVCSEKQRLSLLLKHAFSPEKAAMPLLETHYVPQRDFNQSGLRSKRFQLI